MNFLSEIEELIESLSEFQSLYEDYKHTFIFEKFIETDKNIIIVFSSDIHFGSIYTDYKRLLSLWKAIINTENLYLCVVGDFIDNFDIANIKLMQAGVNSQLITPQLQRELLVKFISELSNKNKILAMVLGNHEAFSHQYPYFSLIKGVPIASNRLLLKLSLNDILYKIALIHRSRFNSLLNPTHSSWRELTLHYPDADIVVTAHTHSPSLMIYPYPKNERMINRVLIKTGSLKYDLYGSSNFNPYHSPSIPAVVLSSNKEKITAFFDFEDALSFAK